MAKNGGVKRGIKSLQQVKTWQLIILLILAAFIAATFLRLNNIGMVQRRDAVISADKQGGEEEIITRLYDLQRYVSSHMNTSLGKGVYLEHSYTRDYNAWQEKEYGDANPNGNIYKKAQEVCAPQFSNYSQAYLQCTTNELEKYPAASELGSGSDEPRQEAYIHSFTSPLWSSDFAGWSVLVCLFILLLIAVRLVSLGVLQIMLRRRYRRV